ncbi:MAG: U32 family peptidase C-terminal domain-containing protein [Candidatus Gastranaerophilaceae bacterium]|jgi:putative protease
MKKLELLLPAGNIEKLEYAIAYGADAVYFGLSDFSLRSMKQGEIIDLNNLKTAVDTAKLLGAKAYITLNIFAFNHDIESLISKIDVLKDANPDAIIFSDFGIYNVLKKYLPDMPLHVSTQTNTLNYEAVKFWQDMGIQRVVLARELSIKEISDIKKHVPQMELECFVHGSQCVSFSGRCLLSDYMTKSARKANHGNCTQPCRWDYKLLEEKRPNEYLDITEYDRGTFILSPKDLCLIEYIPQLIEAGVDSFKVEGRTKSVYYVSVVAKAYKTAIESYLSGKSINSHELFEELCKVGNRGYTQGFYINSENKDGYSYETSKGIAGATFLAVVDAEDKGYLKIKIKNKIQLNDDVEIISPKGNIIVKIVEIKDIYGNFLEVANTNEEVYIKADKNIDSWKKSLIRFPGVRYAL